MSSPSCSTLPTLHWGVIGKQTFNQAMNPALYFKLLILTSLSPGTGLAASWFATDLNLPRANAQARHVIQAIGSSSIEKGETFAKTHLPGVDVTIYNTYEQVYADTKVDIIYIATPATFHKKELFGCYRGRKARSLREAIHYHCSGATGCDRCSESQGRVSHGGNVVEISSPSARAIEENLRG